MSMDVQSYVGAKMELVGSVASCLDIVNTDMGNPDVEHFGMESLVNFEMELLVAVSE